MSVRFTACSIASPAYHAHARVMAESFLEHHPDCRVAIVDLGSAESGAGGTMEPFDERVELIEPEALVGGRAQLKQMGLAYTTQGLAGAMKPRLLRHLVVRNRRPAMLIDADMYVYATLGEIAARAEREGAVLTTHIVSPNESAERPMLLAGTFNSGFLAVGEGAIPLLEWWSKRTHRECIYRPRAGIVWEQSWLGLTPALFKITSLRDAGVNAMSRELYEQDIELREGRPHLAGRPLRCMHFSGPYDPREPGMLLSQVEEGRGIVQRAGPHGMDGLSWLSLEHRPNAATLSARYAERLIDAGALDHRGAEPPFRRLPSGLPIHWGMRTAYREALIGAERQGGSRPPNPLGDDSEETFVRWLAEPRTDAPGLNRFLHGFWQGGPGAAAFPAIPGADTDPFLGWASRTLGRGPRLIPPGLLRPLGGSASSLLARGLTRLRTLRR